jgi:hypothetical protein
VHAAIGPAGLLLNERRTLYQLAVELLEPDRPALDLDVVDSPVARGHIGDVLAGRAPLRHCELVGISAMTSDGTTTPELQVAARPMAGAMLAGPLDTVALELGRQGVAPGSVQLLTEADGERFLSAVGMLADGTALARSVNPELIDDLLAHVALVGMVNPLPEGKLVSASCRAYPGLILLEARSSIGVAEALVHEGAHQKLFDLAITHDLLSVDSDRCPPFHPSWAPEGHVWSMEQTLAACHAYACLARFAQDAGVGSSAATEAPVVGEHSLLPVAAERCVIIGQWLLGHSDHLGPDARVLLGHLLGRSPRTAWRPTPTNPAAVAGDYAVIDPVLTFRRCGSTDRVLVGCATRPPQLYWLGEDAAALLELLGHQPFETVLNAFAQRWSIPRSDAGGRLAVLLSELSESGLVTALP